MSKILNILLLDDEPIVGKRLVIIITGYAMMSLAGEAMDKGAFDFIAKPFNPDDLKQIIVHAAEVLGFQLSIASS